MGFIFKWKFSSEYVHLKGTSSILVGFCASSFFLALLDFSLQFWKILLTDLLCKTYSYFCWQSGCLYWSSSLPDTTDVERVTGDSQAAQYSLYWTSTLLHLLILHNYHSLFIICSPYLYFYHVHLPHSLSLAIDCFYWIF